MDVLIRFEGENELEFVKRFSSKEACYEYLYFYKWKDGFLCPHCKSDQEHVCSKPYHKRCKKCSYLISPTVNTLFQDMRFGIDKAFYIVFKMSCTTKSISAEQLSKTLSINRKSALAFQHKVRLAMKSSGGNPLMGQVEVDEAFIGEQEEGNIGRGAENKVQIVIAVEKQGGKGIKRAYAKIINNASAEELRPFFNSTISPQANVLTDKWRGYLPLKETHNIRQEKSDPKNNFKVIHRCIQQLKSWLRGIHHSANRLYLQNYLNEFCFRLNRSIFKQTIFDNLIKRMILTEYVPIKQIKFRVSI